MTTTSELAHPRAIVENLNSEQPQHVAVDLAIQLASIHVAIDSKLETGSIVPPHEPEATRDRAAQILTESLAWSS
ncbi:hypothetical protein VQ042_22275 [Aurantimonas sp. A2-1-M11]|uniref:hypothetical protein n=1 Tax=Aurantimonas sp. A2-1-M11 TaxID=3113712 RepID=UPI002F93C4F3